jgi:hypothetical protein
MLYTSTITRPCHRSGARSGRREFILLYALAAAALLLLTTAFTLSWGRTTDVGGVNLNSLGGLLLGATQGLLQYAILRSRYRVSPFWVAAPAVAWALAMGIDWPLDGQGPRAGIWGGIVSQGYAPPPKSTQLGHRDRGFSRGFDRNAYALLQPSLRLGFVHSIR